MMLGGQEATTLARFCALVVPGSETVDPVSYVERVLAGMSPVEEDRVHAALGLVARYLDAPERIADTEGFQLLRPAGSRGPDRPRGHRLRTPTDPLAPQGLDLPRPTGPPP
jgi:hypothetical protein